MPILKNKTQGNFVLVAQRVLHDRNLGITERGLLVTLMSLPDGWNFTRSGLQSILPDGKDKITTALNRLEKLGYIDITQDKSDSGRYGNNILEVRFIPKPPDEEKEAKQLSIETPFMGNPIAENPVAENPLTENPTTAEPLAGFPQQLNNNISINNKLNNKRVNMKGCANSAVKENTNGRKEQTRNEPDNGSNHNWSNAEKEFYGL